MNTYKLIISSPDGTVFSGEAVFLSLRGATGDLAILAGHIPFITSIRPCECKVVFSDGTERKALIDGGLLSVDAEKVTLLSGSFLWNE